MVYSLGSFLSSCVRFLMTKFLGYVSDKALENKYVQLQLFSISILST